MIFFQFGNKMYQIKNQQVINLVCSQMFIKKHRVKNETVFCIVCEKGLSILLLP